MNQINNIPIPKDIPLPLPAPEWLLVTLLVISFIAHILFVNLMVGGSILTIFFEYLGLKKKPYDHLAHEIARTITVNKSMAVVLGVAPLLLINTLYTVYFYTANSMTGLAWILVVPLVTVAFLITYLHKYTWDVLKDNKPLHIFIGSVALLIFLFIPLIFLANVNLMLFPERWTDVEGFLSALLLPNALIRYLHFLMASLSATSLFLIGYFKRKKFPFDSVFKDLKREDVILVFYSITLATSATQFLVGPLVYFSLPSHGITAKMTITILIGVTLAIPAIIWLWKEITGEAKVRGQHFKKIVTCLALTVLFMATGRHMYREAAIEPHRRQMKAKTEEYMKQVELAANEAKSRASAAPADTSTLGEKTFSTYCAGCHTLNERLVGPPIKEIQTIYVGNPDGIVSWAKAPGKKRPDYPPMPPISIDEKELKAAAEYMLKM